MNKPVNLRGHFYQCNKSYIDSKLSIVQLLFKYKERLPEIGASIYDHNDIGECYHCGEDVILAEVDGHLTATQPCQYPKGIPAYSVEIDCPSGQLAFGNDFRRQFPLLDGFDVNLGSERKRCTEAYAAYGCLHAYVGNSCPGVYKLDDGNLIIGSRDNLGERVGGIGTDLWWVSVADYEHLKKRAQSLNKEIPDIDIVDVASGKYRCTIYFHILSEKERYGQSIYIIIENISDKTSPFAQILTGENIRFEQEMALARMSYPTLYESRDDVLNEFFCSGGTHWYDGSLVSSGSKRHKALQLYQAGERPVWKDIGRHKNPGVFHPLDEYSALCKIPDNIRRDWLLAVRETIDLILSSDPDAEYFPSHEPKNSHNIEMAVKIKSDLDRRFPQ